MTWGIIDETHDPATRSWVSGTNDVKSAFPPQNLPFGVFSAAGHYNASQRLGVAIGDFVLDLREALDRRLLHGDLVTKALQTKSGKLNHFMESGSKIRQDVRRQLFSLLTQKKYIQMVSPALLPLNRVKMHLPFDVYGFTDFYAGIHHAINVGRLFRPDNPLLPNYKYIPIAYNSRASTVGVSGEMILRPSGQLKEPAQSVPVFAPSRALDYEVELGMVIGTSSIRNQPINPSSAWEHIFGFLILNDWSARDIQAWEYQPLGPYLGKSFATTISSWIITPEALAPFKTSLMKRASGDPAPLSHLIDDEDCSSGAFEVSIETFIQTRKMKNGQIPHVRLSLGNTRDLYWTCGQMLTHMTSNGSNIRNGDLIGSGTISGPERSSWGSLIELTQGGSIPIKLPNSDQRFYLEDGDEVIIRGQCNRAGFKSISFGECIGRIADSH